MGAKRPDKADKIKILQGSSIFSSLDESELAELAEIVSEKEFRQGDHIFWEGDRAAYFYVLAAGRIKVSKMSPSGREFVLAFFGPGDIFGEVAVFEDKPYPASAQATESTTVLAVGKDSFTKFLSRHPAVALKIINMLGSRLRDAMGRLRDLAGERVEQRIAAILVMLSSKFGPELPFTRREIADMAGTTIETTIRTMTRFKKGGVIKSARGRLTVLDKKILSTIAEGLPQE
ncbi:MAG: Crp/Fnr family transcriptional regulator [Dehalococcoidia bacterium]